MFNSANQSREWEFDLQRFNDGEPAGEPSQEPSPEPSGGPSGEPTPAAEPAPEPAEPFLKIKYNKEEIPLTMEETITLAQKGRNYDKVNEKYQELANHRGLGFLNRLAEENGVTVEALLEHWEQEREQRRVNELVERNNIPEDVAKELIENRKFREQYEQERRANETKREYEKRIQAGVKAFRDKYPDVDASTIPQEVFEAADKHGSLVAAYAEWENQSLKAETERLRAALGVQEKNKANAASSPGSVTGQGAITGDFISEATFDANKHDQEWVMKNFNVITKSRAKW